MAKYPSSVIQAFLAQLPSNSEVNLNTLATQLAENNLQAAITFFSKLDEPTKVKYLVFLHNYYYHTLTGGSYLLEPTEAFSEEFIAEIEDSFIKPFNLDTTTLVAIRRLVSRMQKEIAKQRVYKKEEVVEVASDNAND